MRGSGTWIGRFLAVALVAALACATAATAAEAPVVAPGATAAAQPPVRISADAAEYFNKEGLVVFTGNVVAVQSDSTLTAERMEVTFSAPEPAGKKPAGAIGGAAGGRRITTITALKSVSLRQVDPETKKERYATGDKGVYDADRRLVTMTGSPRLWEDKNVIVGEEMIFHLEDRKVIVSGKVNLTVFPDDAKEGKKP